MTRTTASRSDGSYSQSLERGLALLASFSSARPLLGVSELAREVGLSRSTAHRYIATLAALGYLDQDVVTRKYRLGLRVLDLGFAAINSMELRQISAPHLQRLSDETGHTVNMAILDGPDIVYVERCRSAQRGQREIDLDLHVGSRLPAYCTSMGKVLLAHLPTDRRDALLGDVRLSQRGPNTLTSRPHCLPSSGACTRRTSPSTTRSSPSGFARSPLPCVARQGTSSPRSTSPCTARGARWRTSYGG